MKRIIISLVVLFLFFPLFTQASTESIPFSHDPVYGSWKKTISSKPQEPLYVSFTRNYGVPDKDGNFYDKAMIAVMEPPKEHATYEALIDFMEPKPITNNKAIKLENDPLTFSELTLGGAKGKQIRGTAKLIYVDNSFPPTNLIAKGYFFETKNGIIEILVQIRSLKGDILKIEQDVDDFIGSFRFGLLEDMGLIRFLKEYKPSNLPAEVPQNKPVFPLVYLVFGGLGIIVISSLFVIFFLKRKRGIKKPLDSAVVKPKRKKKKN